MTKVTEKALKTFVVVGADVQRTELAAARFVVDAGGVHFLDGREEVTAYFPGGVHVVSGDAMQAVEGPSMRELFDKISNLPFVTTDRNLRLHGFIKRVAELFCGDGQYGAVTDAKLLGEIESDIQRLKSLDGSI